MNYKKLDVMVIELKSKVSFHFLLFLLAFLNYAYFFHPQAGWNVNSRLALTYALVDYGTFRINNYYWKEEFNTGDIAVYGGNYYCDKIIGTSLLGTIPYTALRLAGGRYLAERYPELAHYFTRTLSVSIFGALAVVVMYDVLLLFSATRSIALFLTLLFAFGTMLFPYSTVFYPYAPATFFVLLAWRKILQSCPPFTLKYAFFTGLALGLALLFEYIFGIVVLALTIYLIWKLRPSIKAIFVYVIGIILALLPFIVYTLSIFGTLTIPYKYEAFPVFQQGMAQGIMGITKPRLAVLYYITIHPYRGLFVISPFLIFAFVGALIWLRHRKYIAETILSLIIIFSYLLFNASYYMWWGGWTYAPRHLFPLLPFMFPLLIPIFRTKFPVKTMFYLAALFGILFNFTAAAVEPQEPQGYQTAVLLNPRISFNLASRFFYRQLPALALGQLDPNLGMLFDLSALYSLLPLVFISVILLFLMYLKLKNLNYN